MRSWALRQPSAKVKQHIFGLDGGHEARPERERRSALPLWSFLAPVAACLFVAMATLNQHESAGPDSYFGATVASNRNYTISSSNTFDWTNHPEIPSSVRSQLVPGTNK